VCAIAQVLWTQWRYVNLTGTRPDGRRTTAMNPFLSMTMLEALERGLASWLTEASGARMAAASFARREAL
jgi:hypothetical protein